MKQQRKGVPLRFKQWGGFGIILLVMAGINVFSLLKLDTLKDDLDEVTLRGLPSVILIGDIEANISKFRIAETGYATASDKVLKYEYETILTKSRDTIERDRREYEQKVRTAQEKNFYTSFARKWNKYLELHEKFMDFSRQGQRDEAIQLLNTSQLRLFEDFTTDLQQLVRINKANSIIATRNAKYTYDQTFLITIWVFMATFLLSLAITWYLVRSVSLPLKELSLAADAVAKGDVDVKLKIRTKDEIGDLALSFNQMTHSLKEVRTTNAQKNWVKNGLNQLNDTIRGDHDVQTLAKRVVTFLSKYMEAQVGVFYLSDETRKVVQLIASYAFSHRKSPQNTVKVGEGIVGQAAYEKEIILLTDLPHDYMAIDSALGDTTARHVIIVPFLYEDDLIGVMEFATYRKFREREQEFLKTVAEPIAVAFNSVQSNYKIKFLLQESKRQSQTLQTQQNELRKANQVLEKQTKALRKSESKLRTQQEELQAANEELEEKTQYLQQQKLEISKKNKDLEQIRSDLETKAKELEITGKYKSEFLANMSHELRTPLNSLLILAQSLTEDTENNLTEDQHKSAEIIYKSGNDLLNLINDILDLSKIESGKLRLSFETFRFSEIVQNIEYTFGHMAQEKKLALNFDIAKELPEFLKTDRQRLEQIVKNLLSNAIKFTSEGSVTVQFFRPTSEVDLSQSKLNPEDSFGMAVIDTGIGIPENKSLLIFEAFQQADGSTSRQYGGTGLGLSISKELSRLLGGEIQLKSETGKGSTFTVYLPLEKSNNVNLNKLPLPNESSFVAKKEFHFPKTIRSTSLKTPEKPLQKSLQKSTVGQIKDDRSQITANDLVILIIEDDTNFAQILQRQCRTKGFKSIVTSSGEEGLSLANKYTPSAIILDIRLPDISGWEVLERLKETPQHRHIPIHMMSGEEARQDALQKGAIGFLNKPVRKTDLDRAFGKIKNVVHKTIKDLLLIEDDPNLRLSVKKLIGENDLQITDAATGKEAFEKLSQYQFDCVVLDLGLPDMTGFELIEKLEKTRDIHIPPIIVYTGREISREEENRLREYADSIIIKGVKSEDRLLDETALFLHRIIENMPQDKRKIIQKLYDKDEIFRGKKLLLVDDDMRNVFALSRVLREKEMNILKAENGEKALKILTQNPDINLVLMDIMMPVMDGYEAMTKIREMALFKELPVIALTAKAMKEDRQKCLEAGASDYLTKPVDTERLLSTMRVWLYK